MSDRSTKRVFLDISIDGQKEGRIIIELFDKIAPRTCENFRALCNGDYGKVQNVNMTYRGSPFHRVVKNFMIQGGDITAGNGTGGMSIYGRTFDDEEFMESHSEPYLLSMANRGPNTNSSQFFITTAIARHLDTKHVVFGRVVKGKEIVDKIEKIRVNEASKPYQDVMISSCGELFKKNKAPEPEETPEDPHQRVKKEPGVKDEPEEEEEPEIPVEVSTVRAEDLPPEPKTRNWLLRRSRSRSTDKDDDRKKRKGSRSRDSKGRKRKDSSRESRRDGRRHHSRSRSPRRRSPDRYSRMERHSRETGVKVKGRGALRFQRDTTPPHWRKEESKKTSLEDYQNRLKKEEEEERMKIVNKKKEEMAAIEKAEKKVRPKSEPEDSDSDEQENEDTGKIDLDGFEEDVKPAVV